MELEGDKKGPQREGVTQETGGRSLLFFRKLYSKADQEFLPVPSA